MQKVNTPASTPGDRYSRYRSNPAEFGEEVFGEIYTEDIISVMNSVVNTPVTIAKSGNGTGKSHGAARIAIWFYKCFPNSQVYTAAAPPERNLEKILWGEIGDLVQKHPEVFTEDRITRDMNIQRSPLSFITGVTIPTAGSPRDREAKFSGKHAPNILFIVDEGDAVPDEVYKGIESGMSGGNARLLIMFNPRQEVGPVAQMEKKKQGNVITLSAFNHPNVITGEEKIVGAVSREATVRRINDWTRPLLDDELTDKGEPLQPGECFKVPDYLVGATSTSKEGVSFPPLPGGWRKVTTEGYPFWYMVLGQYPPQGEMQLISRAWIEAAVSRYHTYVATYGERPPIDSGVAGLDVSDRGKDWNVLTFRYGGYVPTQIRWQGMDPDMTAIKAADLCYRDGRNIRAFVDGTGVGAGVAPRMMRLGAVATSVMVASSPEYKTELGVFGILRDQLWWSCREWLRDEPNHPSYAMLPPDEELIDELLCPMYDINSGKIRVTKKVVMKEILGRSPDKADSLCLTFAENNESELVVGEDPMEGWRG